MDTASASQPKENDATLHLSGRSKTLPASAASSLAFSAMFLAASMTPTDAFGGRLAFSKASSPKAKSRKAHGGTLAMSTPWYAGSADPQAWGGGQSPDPVTPGDTSWTWDVEFAPVSQSLYARASLAFLSNIGGGTGWVGGGIVAYRTRNSDGSDTNHPVGQSGVDGIVDLIWDSNVDSVTFGWLVEGDNFCYGRINMEIWI